MDEYDFDFSALVRGSKSLPPSHPFSSNLCSFVKRALESVRSFVNEKVFAISDVKIQLSYRAPR